MENFKSESIAELTKAVCATILEINGIDKNMTVGEGSYSYKGVSDKDVKNVVGKAMAKNGLAIIPIGIDADTDITKYQYQGKQKQQVFVKANTFYLLMHTSGEWIRTVGLGHGIDSQDKAPGKATTYALKYNMLYSFAVSTGQIDDTDTEHSEEKEVFPEPVKEPVKTEQKKLKCTFRS